MRGSPREHSGSPGAGSKPLDIWQMSFRLAWSDLIHDRTRLLASISGVAFAVFLILIEVGFLNGIYDTQTELVYQLDGDLFLINRLKDDILPTRPFERTRLHQASAISGVKSVHPLYMNEFTGVWKSPGGEHSHVILALGLDPAHQVLRIPEVRAAKAALQLPDTALFDRRSRDLYGRPAVGDVAELANRRVRLVGTFEMGPSFRNDGVAVMSDSNFLRYFPDPLTGRPDPDAVEIGILRLEPGSDPDAVRRSVDERLPNDVAVLTADDFAGRIRTFWSIYQPIGIIFGLGAAIGFAIGVTICYQVLFNDISDNLPQLATLKAMGYTDGFLSRLVACKALMLSLLGFLPGTLLGLALYNSLESWTGIRMWLTVPRAAIVLVLSIGMCVLAGRFAARKTRTADPADLF
jgi:putative ABC transport system permease protein